MEIAKYILQILRTQPIIVMSWAARQFTAITNGLAFRVSGFKHDGIVEVVYDEGSDVFVVRLFNGTQLIREIGDVYFDILVSVIDEAVERVNAYEEHVKNAYNIY